MPPDNPLTAAYEMGYYAGVNGEDPRLCPFPNMSAEWKAWNQAHDHGATMHRAANHWADRLKVVDPHV